MTSAIAPRAAGVVTSTAPAIARRRDSTMVDPNARGAWCLVCKRFAAPTQTRADHERTESHRAAAAGERKP